MEILGIGTDLVSIARIREIWERFSFAFAKRILTKQELQELEDGVKIKNPVPFLAKRYAAKEALAKALGTGFQPNGILLNEIGVKNDDLGRPHLEFYGKTAKEIESRGIHTSHVSLSDERDYAIAFVILMK